MLHRLGVLCVRRHSKVAIGLLCGAFNFVVQDPKGSTKNGLDLVSTA